MAIETQLVNFNSSLDGYGPGDYVPGQFADVINALLTTVKADAPGNTAVATIPAVQKLGEKSKATVGELRLIAGQLIAAVDDGPHIA